MSVRDIASVGTGPRSFVRERWWSMRTFHVSRRLRPPLTLAVATIGPLLALYTLSSIPGLDQPLQLPLAHFYVGTAVSAAALMLAAMLAVAAVQIGLYRALFLALGFIALGAFFSIHTLSTPGVLRSAGTVTNGLSALLSLFVPALFFVATYLPVTAQLERRFPFWPATCLVGLVVVGLVSYGVLTFDHGAPMERIEFNPEPYAGPLTVLTVILLAIAAIAQTRSYLASRLSTQGALAVAFILLAEARLGMALAPAWTAAWWAYHLLVFGGVGLALWSLITERAHGQSLRDIVETTLELEVTIGAELEHVDTIARLASALEAKDQQTQGHNCRVAQLAAAIGHEMGLSTGDLRVLARSGLLHDVGKLSIPNSILLKPGPLDDRELLVMKQHPRLGVELMHSFGYFGRETRAVLHHHERVDGSGYPDGLAGNRIPLEARIIAVADTYDVLVSDRTYRRGRSRDEALRILDGLSGTHLDPRVVRAVLAVISSRCRILAI